MWLNPFVPDNLKASYEAWLESGDEESLNRVVNHLKPRMSYHLHRLGLGSDGLAKIQAKIYTARAVKTYDPTKAASLSTWTDRNLLQLNRFNRTRATAVKVPERTQLDAQKLNEAEKRFEDKHGRLPSLDELADAVQLPVSRIERIRKEFRKTVGEEAIPEEGRATEIPPMVEEAMDALWEDSDAVDRKVLELTTGYGRTRKVRKASEAARVLKMHPANLSRRKARLAARLDEILEMLEKQTKGGRA